MTKMHEKIWDLVKETHHYHRGPYSIHIRGRVWAPVRVRVKVPLRRVRLQAVEKMNA